MAAYPYRKTQDNGVKRADTENIFLLQIPRLEVAKTLEKEFGKFSHPGIYILYHSKLKKFYVGESSDLKNRVDNHMRSDPKELKEWNIAYIINDMRQIKYSKFANSDVRKKIEKLIIQELEENDFIVGNKVKEQLNLSEEQRRSAEKLFDEIRFLMVEYRMISEKEIEAVDEDEKNIDEMIEFLISLGHSTQLNQYEGIVDDLPAYMRPGSRKPKGWQITLRDTFRQSVRDKDGYLLVNRGRCLLIPFSEIRTFLQDKLNQDTVDVFVNFISNTRANICYQDKALDVSSFFLTKDE